jgi:23S rRNA (cytosine1962-C5)-methyltransferase
MPGLIVDRYEDCLALQTLSLGMDRMKETVCDALEEVLKPRCIVERNESALREREGLPMQAGVLRGTPPETVRVREGDLLFDVRLMGGHKTGYYFDQRENRQAMRRFAPGTRALDAYCHDGGFALSLARGGAHAVLGVDISAEAIEAARGNAALNGLDQVCEFQPGDVGPALEALHTGNERFDIIVLDPPSFTRTKKNVPAARKGYEEINRKAMRILRRGGILGTASCSFHITDETFMGSVQEAAFRTQRVLRLLEWRSQAPDHPILPSMPETRYLKFGIFEVD